MKLISILIKESRQLFLLSVIASVLAGACSTLIIRAVHLVINGDISRFDIFLKQFLPFLIGYLILSVSASYGVSLLSKKIIHHLRLDLTERIIKADYSILENVKAKLLPILTDDISTIAIVIQRLPSVVNGAATVGGILVYMIWLSPALSLMTLVAFMIIFLINKVGLKFIGKFTKLSREYTNRVYEAFEGLVYGLKSLKLNFSFRKSFIKEDVIPGSEKQTQYYLYNNVLNAVVSRLNDVVLFIFLAVIIGAIFISDFVTMDFFNKYLTLILFMLAPLSTISGFLGNMKRIDAAIEQIDNIGLEMNESSEVAKGEDFNSNEKHDEFIELKDVVYTHKDDEKNFKLGEINIQIKKGEILFLTGGNGSGKTSLIKLISGLYIPDSGKIKYSGFEVHEENITSYRDLFGVIFTDSFIFDHLKHIPTERIEESGKEYLSLLNLDGKVEIKDGRFSSVQLSEGQKKRLVLLKALLEDKSIYVFDEWVAYQDQETKKLFFNEILPYLQKKGKTIINIAHDTGFEYAADRSIHLSFGKIDSVSENTSKI
ncbi:MAG: cyclic peptide export ABC transporter [Balneola sp.]